MRLSTSLAISLSRAAVNLLLSNSGGGIMSECYRSSSASGIGLPNYIL